MYHKKLQVVYQLIIIQQPSCYLTTYKNQNVGEIVVALQTAKTFLFNISLNFFAFLLAKIIIQKQQLVQRQIYYGEQISIDCNTTFICNIYTSYKFPNSRCARVVIPKCYCESRASLVKKRLIIEKNSSKLVEKRSKIKEGL